MTSRRDSARSASARTRRGRRLPGQPDRTHNARLARRRAAAHRARSARSNASRRRPPINSRTCSPRAQMFGDALADPGARHRSRRLLPVLGAQPAGVERQHHDGARHRAPAQGAARARRQARRDRSAAHRDRARGRRVTTSSGRAPTRAAARDAARALRGGARRPGRVGGLDGTRRVRARRAAKFPPERVAAATGIAADDDRGACTRARAAPAASSTARVGVCQHEFGRGRGVAGRRAQRRAPATSIAPAA